MLTHTFDVYMIILQHPRIERKEIQDHKASSESVLISGWDKDISSNLAVQEQEADSMVRYGGVIADDEDEAIQQICNDFRL
jgi:hypothetical protein